MSFDFSTLITDRSAADVTKVKGLFKKVQNGTASSAEITEFNNAVLKGAYNYTDLNRVGFAMEYLADRLNSYGYFVNVNVKTDWNEQEWPTPTDMCLYLSSLAILRSAFAQMQKTPKAPSSMHKLTIAEANNIEQILEDVDFLLTCSSKSWYFSGDLFSGEV